MKKRNTIFMASFLALALLASCKKDNNTNQNLAGTDLMRANIEQPAGNGSRTHIEVNGNEGRVRWNEGDQFLVVDANGDDYTFTLKGGQSGETEPVFSSFGSDNMASPFAAAYPATNSIEGTTATITLPATQAYAEGSFANGTNVMVGYQAGSEREVSFKNVLGGLCFPLVGNNVTVTSIVLTSNNTNDHLSGTFTVNCNSDAPELTYVSDGGNSITIDCGSGVTLSSTPTDFYIMLPPGSLENGFTVKAYNNGAEVMSESTDNTSGVALVERNKINKLNENLLVGIPEKAFSVAAGSYVWFALGNLQATTTDLGNSWTWSFAAHQYDCIGETVANNTINGNGTVSTNGTVDLFGFSTTTNYYGISTFDDEYYLGDFRDWGTVSITNGDNYQWRTLSVYEWKYLIESRTNCENLYGFGSINGIHGLILLPDDWDFTTGPSFSTVHDIWWAANTYTVAEWLEMENKGAIFLPAAGYRDVPGLYDVNELGTYYSSYRESDNAYGLVMASPEVPGAPSGVGLFLPYFPTTPCYGCSVRLVRTAN